MLLSYNFSWYKYLGNLFMIYIFVQRLVVAFFTIVTLASCADYLTDNNNQTVNGKIGLPGSVNLLNTATNGQATKAINSISVPEITTRTAFGGEHPLFCRYTTVPGINKNKREATSNVAKQYLQAHNIAKISGSRTVLVNMTSNPELAKKVATHIFDVTSLEFKKIALK